MAMRIGIGFDVHQLVENRPLIIGGITIPHEKGLLGHSDADVLSHAITDAILGAGTLGSIGDHFPDTDPAYKNMDSQIFLAKANELIQQKGFKIEHIDSVIVAQEPKMKGHVPAMQDALAKTLGLTPENIGIKATTTEHLGFEGRKEGISAHAVVLLVRQ
jgi:2-C-methyl-D-erythritol 2,4-cyclodiphosphate synthase